ncbi:MAG: hypothetical protein NXY57DRAFT_979744, partial [Lentinula lateritia]
PLLFEITISFICALCLSLCLFTVASQRIRTSRLLLPASCLVATVQHVSAAKFR